MRLYAMTVNLLKLIVNSKISANSSNIFSVLAGVAQNERRPCIPYANLPDDDIIKESRYAARLKLMLAKLCMFQLIYGSCLRTASFANLRSKIL